LHIIQHVNKYANEPKTTVKQYTSCFSVLFQFYFTCKRRITCRGGFCRRYRRIS